MFKRIALIMDAQRKAAARKELETRTGKKYQNPRQTPETAAQITARTPNKTANRHPGFNHRT